MQLPLCYYLFNVHRLLRLKGRWLQPSALNTNMHAVPARGHGCSGCWYGMRHANSHCACDEGIPWSPLAAELGRSCLITRFNTCKHSRDPFRPCTSWWPHCWTVVGNASLRNIRVSVQVVATRRHNSGATLWSAVVCRCVCRTLLCQEQVQRAPHAAENFSYLRNKKSSDGPSVKTTRSRLKVVPHLAYDKVD